MITSIMAEVFHILQSDHGRPEWYVGHSEIYSIVISIDTVTERLAPAISEEPTATIVRDDSSGGSATR